MKMIFNYDADETHFHNKGFALSLVLKVRCFGTRKWPIRLREHKSLRYFPNITGMVVCFPSMNVFWMSRDPSIVKSQ